jgi:hypothetical protein
MQSLRQSAGTIFSREAERCARVRSKLLDALGRLRGVTRWCQAGFMAKTHAK